MCGTCDGRYARSRQGLCKIGQILLGMLIWIVIAASPYWKPIFLLEGQTWPFHVVMLFVFLPWLATIILYFVFLSGYHYSFGHVNWPKLELIFNVLCLTSYLVAGVIESTNLWRWDYSYGSPMNYNGGVRTTGYYGGGYMGNNNYGGYRRGMGLTQKMNFQSYCMRYPRDCQDYLSMMAGYNTYFGNHIFATVFIWITFVVYLLSTWFAWKMFREFQDKYWKPGKVVNGEQLPAHAWVKPEEEGPSIWKSTIGKLRGGLSVMEQKMNAALKKDDNESEGTEPVGHFRNDQIVRVDHEPETLPFQNTARESDRRSGKSHSSHRSKKKRPHSREGQRSRDERKPVKTTQPVATASGLVEEPHVSMLV